MLDRFHQPDFPECGEIVLEGPEAHHLSHVLRRKPGDRVVLFDGCGAEVEAEVATVGRREVRLGVVGNRRVDSPDPAPLTIASAVPKGDRFRWMIEKLTELGVARFIPLATERSVVTPGRGKLKKLELTVVAACKQCGRNRLMLIDEPTTWETFLTLTASPAGPSDAEASSKLFVADPNGVLLGALASDAVIADAAESASFIVAIGPEGGLTEHEVNAAANIGGRRVSLARTILRIETAAVAAAAWFAQYRDR